MTYYSDNREYILNRCRIKYHNMTFEEKEKYLKKGRINFKLWYTAKKLNEPVKIKTIKLKRVVKKRVYKQKARRVKKKKVITMKPRIMPTSLRLDFD